MSRYRAESITAGAERFGHVGLCLTSVVMDSATYLLTISSPDIDNVAMSLYDITGVIHDMSGHDVLYMIRMSLYDVMS